MKLQDKTRTGGRTTVSGIEVLVASGGKRSHTVTIPNVPPREWFREPTDVTPQGALTITDEGRIYGYLAPADALHRSFPGRRVKVPMGKVDYSKWLGGEALVADGRTVAGVITMNCGHASTNPGDWSYSHRTEHYDNTCSVVAKAAIGENRHGVWIAGALEPYVTAEQVSKMLGCRLSGDWAPHRKRTGWHEFVAALLVPVPGFAMSRTAPSTLVASAAPVRRTPAQREAQRRAAKEDVFRSQPPATRRQAGLPPHPDRPANVMVSAAVPWRYTGTLVASGKQRPFYLSQDRKDQAWRAAFDSARTIMHFESGNLPGEPLVDRHLVLCSTYADLMVAGDVDGGARLLDSMRAGAGMVRRTRIAGAMRDLEVRQKGRVGALAAQEQRRRKARVDRLADNLMGPEKAANVRAMTALRKRMERAQRPGGGSAA